MKRMTRKVTRKAHWYFNGTGFPTKREAMLWAAAERVVFRKGGNGSDLIAATKYHDAVTRELKHVELANK